MSSSYKYICDDCDNSAVLVESGGVHRQLLCPDCNTEMDKRETVETEWVGIEDPENDYRIVE